MTTTTETMPHADVAAGNTKKSTARYLLTAGRVLLGLIFFVFGLDGFLHFFPPPSGPMPEGAVAFGTALMNTGYMFPLIKGTEVAGGVLLLANRFVPLALVLLAPVIVNIVAFNALLAPTSFGAVMVTLIVVIEISLAWAHRSAFRPLLAARATPSST